MAVGIPQLEVVTVEVVPSGFFAGDVCGLVERFDFSFALGQVEQLRGRGEAGDVQKVRLLPVRRRIATEVEPTDFFLEEGRKCDEAC